MYKPRLLRDVAALAHLRRAVHVEVPAEANEDRVANARQEVLRAQKVKALHAPVAALLQGTGARLGSPSEESSQ